MRLRFVAAVLTTAVIVPVQAQSVRDAAAWGDTTTVLPGDARLDPGRLLPHRATWRVTVHDSGGSSTGQGLWTDIWARSQEAGRPTIVFRQLYVDTTGAIVVDNETVFDAVTNRALRSSQHYGSRGSISYRYHGDSVSGTLRLSGAEPRDFRVVFPEPVWEPLAPVLQLLPLERLGEGTTIRYPIWNQAPGPVDVTWTTVRVDSVGSRARAAGSPTRMWHLTQTFEATPNVVYRSWQTPQAPYGWWLRVERPSLVREWSLVDWEPFSRVPRSEP